MVPLLLMNIYLFSLFVLIFVYLFFYWKFSLHKFQILSPFPVFPLKTKQKNNNKKKTKQNKTKQNKKKPCPIFPHPASLRVLPPTPNHSQLPILAYPYTRALTLHRTLFDTKYLCILFEVAIHHYIHQLDSILDSIF